MGQGLLLTQQPAALPEIAEGAKRFITAKQTGESQRDISPQRLRYANAYGLERDSYFLDRVHSLA